jgi:hypothetical protein
MTRIRGGRGAIIPFPVREEEPQAPTTITFRCGHTETFQYLSRSHLSLLREVGPKHLCQKCEQGSGRDSTPEPF